MNCPACGSTMPDGAIFCSSCGAQVALESPGQAFPSAPAVTGQPQGQVPLSSSADSGQLQEQAVPASPAMPAQPQVGAAPAAVPPQSQVPSQAAYQPAPAQTPMPAQYPVGQPSMPAQPPVAVAAPAAASAKKAMSPAKYGIIAAVVIAALIVGAMVIPRGGSQGGTDTPAPTETMPAPVETAPGDDTTGPESTDSDPDDSVLTSATQITYGDVSFTIPAGWEETVLDGGLDYAWYGDGTWADCMVFSAGSNSGFTADAYVEESKDYYGYVETAELKNAQTTSIDGYEVAYFEIVYHNDSSDSYEMQVVMDTPSGELVEMSGTCLNDNQEGKDMLHGIAESLHIS